MIFDILYKLSMCLLYGFLSMFSFIIPLLICVVLIYFFHDRNIFKKDVELKPGCMLYVCLFVSILIYGIIAAYLGSEVYFKLFG